METKKSQGAQISWEDSGYDCGHSWFVFQCQGIFIRLQKRRGELLLFPRSLFWPGDWLYTVSRTLLFFLYFFSADLNIDVRVTTIRGIMVFYVTMGKEAVQTGAERWWWVTAHWQPGPVSQLYPERTQIYITYATYIQYLAYTIKYNMGGFS